MKDIHKGTSGWLHGGIFRTIPEETARRNAGGSSRGIPVGALRRIFVKS